MSPTMLRVRFPPSHPRYCTKKIEKSSLEHKKKEKKRFLVTLESYSSKNVFDLFLKPSRADKKGLESRKIPVAFAGDEIFSASIVFFPERNHLFSFLGIK
jgi:hypothetical protein